jgi:hypothetical protein
MPRPGQLVRQFDDFTCATLDSWSRERRVVAEPHRQGLLAT